jgi:hypothetical protein
VSNDGNYEGAKRARLRKAESPEAEELPEERGSTTALSAAAYIARVRAEESSGERAHRLQQQAGYEARVRAEESPEERERRLRQQAAYETRVRAEESPERRDKRLRQQAACAARVRAEESSQERDLRLRWQAAYEARVRLEGSPEVRARWLSTDVVYPAPLRAVEFLEETTLRLCKLESECGRLFMSMRAPFYTTWGTPAEIGCIFSRRKSDNLIYIPVVVLVTFLNIETLSSFSYS